MLYIALRLPFTSAIACALTFIAALFSPDLTVRVLIFVAEAWVKSARVSVRSVELEILPPASASSVTSARATAWLVSAIVVSTLSILALFPAFVAVWERRLTTCASPFWIIAIAEFFTPPVIPSIETEISSIFTAACASPSAFSCISFACCSSSSAWFLISSAMPAIFSLLSTALSIMSLNVSEPFMSSRIASVISETSMLA